MSGVSVTATPPPELDSVTQELWDGTKLHKMSMMRGSGIAKAPAVYHQLHECVDELS